jgi:hypothetical protein
MQLVLLFIVWFAMGFGIAWTWRAMLDKSDEEEKK